MSDDTPMIGRKVGQPPSKFRLTKDRIKLLKAIDSGLVTSTWSYPDSSWSTQQWIGPANQKTVTHQVNALAGAGFAEEWREPGSGLYEDRWWKLTAEGERVLSENNGGDN